MLEEGHRGIGPGLIGVGEKRLVARVVVDVGEQDRQVGHAAAVLGQVGGDIPAENAISADAGALVEQDAGIVFVHHGALAADGQDIAAEAGDLFGHVVVAADEHRPVSVPCVLPEEPVSGPIAVVGILGRAADAEEAGVTGGAVHGQGGAIERRGILAAGGAGIDEALVGVVFRNQAGLLAQAAEVQVAAVPEIAPPGLVCCEIGGGIAGGARGGKGFDLGLPVGGGRIDAGMHVDGQIDGGGGGGADEFLRSSSHHAGAAHASAEGAVHDGILDGGERVGEAFGGEIVIKRGCAVALIPGDGVRAVVEHVVAAVPIGNGRGGVERAQVHLIGGLDGNRRIAVARDADHWMIGVHPDLQAGFAAGVAGGDEDAAGRQVEGLIERKAVHERVRREFHPHAAELDVGVDLALGVRAADVEEQVAIALDPDVERGLAIAERHRFP